ncbi:MAG: BolA family transcriptional regulator [Acidobacteria bacterium]|nr:BolA family transcriptional regulator [Acidobacteriota bacterium]
MEPKQIEQKIEQAIPGARVSVIGEDDHYSAVVVSSSFEGKTRVQQHQMVYAAVREEMANQIIHALALKTWTPEEAKDQGVTSEEK